VIICAAGDIHGAIDRLYEDVLAFEAALGVRFEWVLHVGDFGVWPDPNRIDKATKKHDGAGDFSVWFAERRPVPRKTLFIKGNHEDFVWLDDQPNPEVLPGLFYLRNGRTMDIGEAGRSVRIGGVGGCFGPADFEQPSKRLQGHAKSHYTRDEIETLCKATAIDILLIHDAPAGVKVDQNRVSEAAGLDRLVAGTQPRICFFGHHHARIDGEVAGIRCIGLNKVRMPGNLVAIDFYSRERKWEILGEWPSFAGRELKK
jgi:Icc-related predicted phosphoesterase